MFFNSIGSTTLNSIKNANRSLLKCNNYLKSSKYLLNSSYSCLNNFDLNKKSRYLQINCTQRINYYSTTAQPKAEKYEFIAETKQLLNIVAKSLYSDKEIFIRELISNASDAIEKLRYMQLNEQTTTNAENNIDRPYEIRLVADDIKNTLILLDTGIGMTKEELIENLGTIAHSGSKAFIEKISKSQNQDGKNIIGQFGVGFYSAFMVSDNVEVITKSYKPNEKAYKWSSAGDGSYEISEVNEDVGFQSGTKIIMHLKKESDEFAKMDRIKGIIKKYSNFVRYPIFLNEEKINILQALWLADSKSITEEQHEEFYKYIASK
jgi:TNF receptor-associated protein 1